MPVDDKLVLTASLVQGATAEIQSHGRSAMLYMAILTGMSILAELGPGLVAPVSMIVRPFVCVAGLYLLLELMLQDVSNPEPASSRRYFSFAGLLALVGVCVTLGIGFWILPGIFLLGRWAIAPSFLVGGCEGVIESLGSSWAATRGRAIGVMGATMMMFLIPLAGAFWLDYIDWAVEVEATIRWLSFHAATLLLAALSVSLYRRWGEDIGKVRTIQQGLAD